MLILHDKKIQIGSLFSSKSLTIIHNYYLKRPNGTAAEGFYENRPIDMFKWLLGNMPQVPRPINVIKKAA